MCPAWGTVISLYETRQLADVAASVMSSETDTPHETKEFKVIGESVAPIDQPELDLDI